MAYRLVLATFLEKYESLLERVWSIPVIGAAVWKTELFIRQICRYGFRGALHRRRVVKKICAQSNND